MIVPKNTVGTLLSDSSPYGVRWDGYDNFLTKTEVKLCEIQFEAEIYCPRGHKLQDHFEESQGICDHCSNIIYTGQHLIDCKICNWYVCDCCAYRGKALHWVSREWQSTTLGHIVVQPPPGDPESRVVSRAPEETWVQNTCRFLCIPK